MAFLRLCAARTGQPLDLDNLSSDAGIPRKVGRQWLSVLEATGVGFLLRPCFTNLAKRQVKAPKLYFLDTGLAAYLTRWPSPETLEASMASGAFFETWVVGELLKNWLGSVPDAPFYYYCGKDKTEIDLLIVQGDMAHPLEIKKTATPGIHDTRHFKALEKTGLRAGTGGLVCLAPAARRLTEKDWIIPAGMI